MSKIPQVEILYLNHNNNKRNTLQLKLITCGPP